MGNIHFIGHVSTDRVENVNGVRTQPGGAALYAAVAAKTLFNNVYLFSSVGREYEFMSFLEPFFPGYIKLMNMPSTNFHIEYNEKWEASYLKAEYGAGSRLSASRIPIEIFKPDDAVHISPIPPEKVHKIVSLIKGASPETKVSVNTWIDYINRGGKNRKLLKQLAETTDLFILDDLEAKALTESTSLSTALRLLRAKTLVVTLGELGAIVKKEDGEVQMVPALNYPVKKIVDTTGAGDTWCGAFVAAYKLTSNLMNSVAAASIISSIKCTGWGFENLWNLRFKGVNDVIEYVIGLREGSVQKRISDYTHPEDS